MYIYSFPHVKIWKKKHKTTGPWMNSKSCFLKRPRICCYGYAWRRKDRCGLCYLGSVQGRSLLSLQMALLPGFPWGYVSSTYRVTLGFLGAHLGGIMVNTGSSGLIGGWKKYWTNRTYIDLCGTKGGRVGAQCEEGTNIMKDPLFVGSGHKIFCRCLTSRSTSFTCAERD